jgi:CRISPR-associated protein Cmr1
MKSLTITLETITPLFLGGADPRGQPELRAASFRGALRFWLRALLGGVLGDRNLTALGQSESAVFGSTDVGASPVVVRVSGSLIGQNFGFGQSPSLDYLFFSMRRAGANPERLAIPAGRTFTLMLQERPGANGTTAAVDRAAAALWLLTHLGGLGARSRRGGGGVQAPQNPDHWPSNVPPLAVAASTPMDLQTELAAGLRQVRQLVSASPNVQVGNPSAFDVLHPEVCRIWVIDKDFATWREALEAVGSFLQTFRRGCSGAEFPGLLDAATGGTTTIPTVQRAAMGLPIVFYDPEARRSVGSVEGERSERRASPVLLRVMKLSGQKCTVVVTFFRARLLPDNEKLALKQGRRSLARGSTPDWNWLENRLLPALGNQVAPLREVIYT